MEDFHTYFVGECGVWVHNANCKVHENGEIEITDWEGYPEGGPKPDGKLKLVDGDDYQLAKKQKMQQTENIIEIILNVMEWIYMKFTLLNLVEAL